MSLLTDCLMCGLVFPSEDEYISEFCSPECATDWRIERGLEQRDEDERADLALIEDDGKTERHDD